MKKKLFVVLMCIISIILISACGGKKITVDPTPQADASGFVQIKGTYKGPEDASMEINGAPVEGLDSYISRKGSFAISYKLKDPKTDEKVTISFKSGDNTDETTVSIKAAK